MRNTLKSIDRDELLDRAVSRIDEVLGALGLARNPNSDKDRIRVGRGSGSMVIQLTGPRAGMWHDFSGAYSAFGQSREGGDLVHLVGAFTPSLSRYGDGIRELDKILGGNNDATVTPRRLPKPPAPAPTDDVAKRRAAVISMLEERSCAITGTPAEAYLKSRGLDPERQGVRRMMALCPKTVRYVENARNYSGKWYHEGPALCLMGRDPDDGGVTNLQQVFLAEGGAGKLDRESPDGRKIDAKKSLGRFVNPARLPAGADGDPAHVALVEGPENGLTFRSSAEIETLIAFGSSGFRRIELANGVRYVTLISDGDLPGSTADESFRDLSRHLRCEGYHVREVRPGVEGRKRDLPDSEADALFSDLRGHLRSEGYQVNEVRAETGDLSDSETDEAVREVRPETGDRKRDLNDLLREEGPEAVEALIAGSEWLRPFPAMSIEDGQVALEGVTEQLIETEVFRANELARARAGDPRVELQQPLDFAKSDTGFPVWVVEQLEEILRRYNVIPKNDAGRVKAKFEARFQREVTSAVGEVVEQLQAEEADPALIAAVSAAHGRLRMISMTPDAARRAADRMYEARMREAGLEVDAPARLVLGSPGLGKTRSISEMIQAADRDAVIWVLQPRTDKAEECVEEIREGLTAAGDDRPVMQVRGRGAANPEGAAPQETMCRRAEAAERVAQIGRPVMSTMCRKVTMDEYGQETEELCPFYDSCAYIKQREMLRTQQGGGVFVMTHAALSGPSDAPRPDLVVVDEDPSQGMVKQQEVGADRLKVDGTVETFLHQAVDDEECVGATLEAITGADALLRAVADALRSEAPLPALVRDVDAGRLRELARALVAAEDRLTHGIGPETNDALVVDTLESAARTEMRRLARVLESVAKEVDLGERMMAAGMDVSDVRPTLNGVRYEPDAEREVDGRKERVSRVTAHRLGKISTRLRIPIIVLDGTADPELLQRGMGRRVETSRIDVRRQGEVQQVVGRSFSSDSLSGRDAYGRKRTGAFEKSSEKIQGLIASMLESEAKKAGTGVFVCAPMRVENAFVTAEEAEEAPCPAARSREDWETAGVHWAHFGATRGMNSWQSCETAVLVGRKQLPPAAAVDLARAFYADDEGPIDVFGAPDAVNAYQKVTRQIYDKHGRGTEVTAMEHADPRVHRVLWQHREAEMIQAMDRVRATRHPRRIVLLNELDLRRPDDDPDPGAGLPADAIVPWEMGLNAGTRVGRVMEKMGGILPLSPTYLQANAKDEFPSIVAAKSWLRRTDLEVLVRTYNSIYDAAPLKIFHVRAEGQRGKPLRVVVDRRRFDTMEDAKNDTARLMGAEIVLFEPEVAEGADTWGDAARAVRPEPEIEVEESEAVREEQEPAEVHRLPSAPEPSGPMPSAPEPAGPMPPPLRTARMWRDTKYGRWLQARIRELTACVQAGDEISDKELGQLFAHKAKLDEEDSELQRVETASDVARIDYFQHHGRRR